MRRLAVHGAWLAALAGCLESPPASGTGGDGGPGTVHPCGTTFALHDDFDGAELDEWRWGTMGTTTLGNDGVRITTATGFANLHSATHYQVSGSQVVAQVDLTGVADATFIMELDSSLNYQVGLRLKNSMLGLQVVDADGEQTVLTAPLEREQGFWRLREEDGGFFWAQSADGETWDEEHGPHPAAIGEVAHVDFDLTPDVEQAAVVVQSVNPGNDSAPYCPASSLTDDFTTESQRWEVHEQGDCMVTLSDGLWLGYSAQAFCGLTSRERFDLEGSAFAVGLLEVVDCKPEPVLLVRLVGGDELSIKCRNDDNVRKVVAAHGTTDVSVVNWDPAKHRHVRVHHDLSDEDNIHFEAAGEDGQWANFGSTPVEPSDLAATEVQLFLGGDTSGGFESVIFDSFNLVP